MNIPTQRINGLLMTLVVVFLSQSALSQTYVSFDQEYQGTMLASQARMIYTVEAQSGKWLEITLNVDERDYPIRLDLLDINDEIIASNEFVNFPYFAGAYIFTQVPVSGLYTIKIHKLLEVDMDFSFIVRQFDGDEANDRPLSVNQSVDGIITNADDADTFSLSVRKGNPVLLTVSTPSSILDSYIQVMNAAGEVVADNNDFFGTGSTLLITPEENGTYQIILYGAYSNSTGPYTMLAHSAPLYNPPFISDEEISIFGDMRIYQIPLKTDEVYDFAAYAIDDFYPLIALTDSRLNVIASSEAREDYPAAFIQGFTPVEDDTLYLLVMGVGADMLGYTEVEVNMREDEEEDIALEHGSIFGGVIGPIGDEDSYLFTAEEGQDYSVLVTPTAHFLDPAVRIMDMQGNMVFYNDDSVDGVFSILSGIDLPAPGQYRIQVFASPDQEMTQRLTGVYVIQLAHGTTFDRSAPYIDFDLIDITSSAAGVHISIPTPAITDDTYPLSATMVFDLSGDEVLFTIEKDKPVELDVETTPGGIIFLTVSDAAWANNSTVPLSAPAPKIIADMEGMPNALAVDTENNLYLTDSALGRISKYALDGSMEIVVEGIPTQGGTLGPNALSIDQEGTLYYSNAVNNSIVKVFPGGATETFVDHLNFPSAMTFDKEGNLLVAQIGSDIVEQIAPDGTRTEYTSAVRNPTGLAFSPDGELLVCNASVGESNIYRIQADGSAALYHDFSTNALRGMAFDRDGFLYVTDEDYGYIYRISPEGERIIFTYDIGSSGGLAFGRGEYSKTLFACSSYYKNSLSSDPLRYYEQRLIAIPTGREGIPVPDVVTAVEDWMIWE